jgi:hypothetical protein
VSFSLFLSLSLSVFLSLSLSFSLSLFYKRTSIDHIATQQQHLTRPQKRKLSRRVRGEKIDNKWEIPATWKWLLFFFPLSLSLSLSLSLFSFLILRVSKNECRRGVGLLLWADLCIHFCDYSSFDRVTRSEDESVAFSGRKKMEAGLPDGVCIF